VRNRSRRAIRSRLAASRDAFLQHPEPNSPRTSHSRLCDSRPGLSSSARMRLVGTLADRLHIAVPAAARAIRSAERSVWSRRLRGRKRQITRAGSLLGVVHDDTPAGHVKLSAGADSAVPQIERPPWAGRYKTVLARLRRRAGLDPQTGVEGAAYYEYIQCLYLPAQAAVDLWDRRHSTAEALRAAGVHHGRLRSTLLPALLSSSAASSTPTTCR